MPIKIKKSIIVASGLTFACIAGADVYAQTGGNNPSNTIKGVNEGDGLRSITTAIPFLTIGVDARAGALGETGAATTPDANASYWNASKLAFIDDDYGFAVSYTPWLRKIVGDMSLSYVTGFKKLSKVDVISFNFTYFNLGEIQFTDQTGAPIKDYTPNEFNIGLSYARRLSEKLSVSASAKFIHSNLTGGVSNGATIDSRPGNTAAVDLGAFYSNPILVGGRPGNISFGGSVSNIGAKISYSASNQRDFIPTNLRLGTAFKAPLDDFNSLTFSFDINKLMVPSPPIRDDQGNIVEGQDPNRSSLNALFTSFADAPDGFSEEMKEIIWNFGTEYWYNDIFAARIGYFHESAMKGDRKFLTFGFGLKYQKFNLDIAYVIATKRNHPLDNTLRFTLGMKFQKEETGTIGDK